MHNNPSPDLPDFNKLSSTALLFFAKSLTNGLLSGIILLLSIQRLISSGGRAPDF